jgi:hypothetical protein
MTQQKKPKTEVVKNVEAKPLSEQVEKTRTRNKSYVMDLRVHSPASLGYLGVEGLDSAPAIVRLAMVKGIDVIAITDFFSGEFVDRMVTAARNSPLTVIPGVDLRCKLASCDDVLLSCLFSEQFTSGDINNLLDELQVPVRMRGNKSYVLSVSLDHILHTIEKFHGVALPSRMDKTPHRMTVIPELVETYGFRAFDLAYADSADYFKKKWPRIKFQLFTFSDANALAQIGSRIARVKLHSPGFAGIKQIVAREGLQG